MKKQQSGFTLVEIAIVMVIIGLLLGGVLKGQEVITNAKIKNVNNDYSGVSAALYSYQDRYSVLPGDDPAPAAHVDGGVLHTTTPANVGNGLIDGAYATNGTLVAVGTNVESALAWQHLRAAGLISGDPGSSLLPSHAFGTVMGMQTASAHADGEINGLTGVVIAFTGVPGDMAVILDAQNDDGAGDGGSIRSQQVSDGADAGAVYTIDGTESYQVLFEL